MSLRNCIECGAICVENPTNLCPACLKAEEEAEDKVAAFLRDIRQASLEEIHKATGVKHKIILRMLKRGRIFSDAVVSYPCETCGAPITEGRVCDDCSQNIIGQIKTPEWHSSPKATRESSRNERLYIKDLIRRK